MIQKRPWHPLWHFRGGDNPAAPFWAPFGLFKIDATKDYDTDKNHQHLQAQGQRSSIIIKHNRTNPQVLGQADPESQRERPGVERKFAEQKHRRGLSQARYWGLAKVTIQALLTCLLVNCNRLANLLRASFGPPRAGLCPANEIGRERRETGEKLNSLPSAQAQSALVPAHRPEN